MGIELSESLSSSRLYNTHISQMLHSNLQWIQQIRVLFMVQICHRKAEECCVGLYLVGTTSHIFFPSHIYRRVLHLIFFEWLWLIFETDYNALCDRATNTVARVSVGAIWGSKSAIHIIVSLENQHKIIYCQYSYIRY